uniref:Segment polarity protein dishevelled (inferred by orthology to a D. melanogaster protein) n=1 Tax=Strongyloides venezuelensis TaxID=75913 RepID=A0A0K0EWY4_STRVS
MSEEKGLSKRKINQYKVKSKTMDFFGSVLAPLRNNSVKELSNTLSESCKGKLMAIQAPSNTSTQDCLVIHEKPLKLLKNPNTVVFEDNSMTPSSKKSPYDEINSDSSKNSIIFKMRSSLKKGKHEHSNGSNVSLKDYSDYDLKPDIFVSNIKNKKSNDKSSLTSKINIFKLFSNTSKKKDSFDERKVRKTKSYNCRMGSLNFTETQSSRFSVCVQKEGNKNDEKNVFNNVCNTIDSHAIQKVNLKDRSLMNEKDGTLPVDSKIANILPQINVNGKNCSGSENNVVRVKLRQPKRYYGSHTTSKFIDCYNEDVPDAPPRRKMIGFLHRTSNFSVDSTYSDDSVIRHSLENKFLLDSEVKEKNNRLSKGTEYVTPSVPTKQRFSHRDRSLRYHRNINVVLNMKVNDFLGINLVGHSSKNGDKGIFIDDIIPGGAISQCGRICVGDEILEMNGISFENVSNDQAVIMLTNEMKKREILRLKIRKHYNSIIEYHNYDKANLSRKSHFNFVRRSLRDYPNHYNFSQPISDDIWMPQKMNKDDENTVELTQILMPAIRESHENLPSSPGIGKKSLVNQNDRKELTMHHVDKLFNLDTNKENVVLSMSLPNSYLEAKEKTWIKINYPMCFLGKHLIDWLLANVKDLKDRRSARNYAFELLKEKLIVHVICRYTFSEQCYYVFGEKIEKLKKADECGIDRLII